MSEIASGSIRFNTDSSKMEIYNGEAWWEINIDHGSGRGLFMGGTPSPDTIDFITIDSTGNAQDFGNLIAPTDEGASVSNQTRAILAGGDSPAEGSITNKIESVTIATTGNGQDFGDLSVGRSRVGSCSNSIRGVFVCGQSAEPATYSNVIDFVTIASEGNATDFGDALITGFEQSGCADAHGGLTQ